jgi:uncharacterized protein (TIGR01777 family)
MDRAFPLLALQAALGAFDIFYHHELRERLAWRNSARLELLLHGLRNVFYAAIFAVMAWCEPAGAWAMLLLAILLAEIGLTLWDFVEEDRTRRLPASERVTHAVLAINYGVVLTLIVPHLLELAARPTALAIVERGAWSWLFTCCALGVGVCAWRDFTRAHALRRAPAPAAPLVAKHLDGARSVLVTGGTGFIGQRLVPALLEAGHRVTLLTRDPARARSMFPVAAVDDLARIEPSAAFDAIVNLAGAPIAAARWTPSRRRTLLRSRIDPTESVLGLITRMWHKPRVLISGSAIGFYGPQNAPGLDEKAVRGPGFAADLCAAWEESARRAEAEGVRVVALRTGLVLDAAGGMLGGLLPAFEYGLGATLGDGRQWMSWIQRDDLVALIAFLIAKDTLSGPVNATAPAPVRNADFTAALAHALHRPAVLRIPELPLRLALGELADELLLGGQHVVPHRAQTAGFTFRYPTLDEALRASVGD